MSGGWKDPSLTRAFKNQKRDAEGAIYQWLWDNHGMVAAGLASGEASWDRIAEKIRESGAAGKFGGKASRWQVAKTWTRVCKAKDEAAKPSGTGAPKRSSPNRSPRNNQPPVPVRADVSSPSTAPARPGSPFAPNAPTLATPANGRPSPDEVRERVRRQLDPRSRYAPPRSTT